MRQLLIFIFFSSIVEKFHCNEYIISGSNHTLECINEIEGGVCTWIHGGKSATKNTQEIPWSAVFTSESSCDLMLINANAENDNGIWKCKVSTEHIPNYNIDPNFNVIVIEEPVFIVNGTAFENKYHVNETYTATCQSEVQEAQIKIFVFNEIEGTHRDISDNKYFPRKGDINLICTVTIVDVLHASFNETQTIEIEEIFYAPILVNETKSDNDSYYITYCANPIPCQIQIKLGRILQHTLVNSSCFYIDVSEEEWTVLDFESFALERAKNGTTMVVDRKRINEDNELLVVKILLPIFCGSIFLVSLIIFILKRTYRNFKQKQSFFQLTLVKYPSMTAINEEDTMMYVPSATDYTQLNSYASTTYQLSTNCDSIYEEIPEYEIPIMPKSASMSQIYDDCTTVQYSNDNNACYDNLNFQRPINDLMGHYYSSRTLQTLNNKEYFHFQTTDL